MKRTMIGIAGFIRHGQSNYTNIPPDLTEVGKRTIFNSAMEFKAIRSNLPGAIALRVASSPSVRAIGSAEIISNVLGVTEEVRQMPLLGPAFLKNMGEAKALFNEHVSKGGMKELCIAYGKDPIYEDGEIIEPRSEVQKRFYKYLGILVRDMLSCSSENRFVIHVSHYEVLYHLLETVFRLDYEEELPLEHGEIILISFYDIGHSEAVEMDIVFRGKTAKGVVFNHKKDKIVAGPA